MFILKNFKLQTEELRLILKRDTFPLLEFPLLEMVRRQERNFYSQSFQKPVKNFTKRFESTIDHFIYLFYFIYLFIYLAKYFGRKCSIFVISGVNKSIIVCKTFSKPVNITSNIISCQFKKIIKSQWMP